jgi:hypothetical protein
MSKQHHFTVWYDTETKKWDIGHASFEEDRPVYDTETEEWSALRGPDSVRDGHIMDDLRRRIEDE